ncbi:MAG: hypothetical protein GY754_18005 [bacterium]|nr:hypothetical protein [bacterium]
MDQQNNQKINKKHYVKVFSGMARQIGLFPVEMIEAVQSMAAAQPDAGSDEIQNEDLGNIELSCLYLLQHFTEGCQANCSFCVQAKESVSKNKKSHLVDNQLTRLPINAFTGYLKESRLEEKGIKRICIQTLFHKETFNDLLLLIQSIRSVFNIPITACSIPLSKDSLQTLKEEGLDMITINYEAAAPELFSDIRGKGVKGPYRWERVTTALVDAVEVFGRNNVGSHLQIGFGESHKEVLSLIQDLKEKGVWVSLFSFCPLPGTLFEDRERVSYGEYHMVQLGSYLIQNGKTTVANMRFDPNGALMDYGINKDTLGEIVTSGIPFQNAGCPGCNRIYYETNPGERFYSYPRKLRQEEVKRIQEEISALL